MSDRSKNDALEQMQRRAQSLERLRRQPRYSPLLGLGAFGVIGWSIALPTVAGAFLGVWLNTVAPQAFSWTLALMLAGLVFGIVLAASWVARQQIQNDARDDGDDGPNNDGDGGRDEP